MEPLRFYLARQVTSPEDDLAVLSKSTYSHTRDTMQTIYEEEFPLLAAKFSLWTEYDKATGLGTSPQVLELLMDRAMALGKCESFLGQMRGTIKHEFLKLGYTKRPWESGRIRDFFRRAHKHYETVGVQRKRGLEEKHIVEALRLYAEKKWDVRRTFAVVFSYEAMLRISESCAMTLAMFRRCPQSLVFSPAFKTKTTQDPRRVEPIVLSWDGDLPTFRSVPLFDPLVAAMREKTDKKIFGDPRGFREAVKALALLCGDDPAEFSGHSPRRGGATLARRGGAGVDAIKVHGRWTTDTYRLYTGVEQELASGEVGVAMQRAAAKVVPKAVVATKGLPDFLHEEDD
jgi:hypothetical protein